MGKISGNVGLTVFQEVIPNEFRRKDIDFRPKTFIGINFINRFTVYQR